MIMYLAIRKRARYAVTPLPLAVFQNHKNAAARFMALSASAGNAHSKSNSWPQVKRKTPFPVDTRVRSNLPKGR